jgi:hypothetical protein
MYSGFPSSWAAISVEIKAIQLMITRDKINPFRDK